MEITETLNVDYIIKGLALYFTPINSLSNKKKRWAVECKPRGLKVRLYVAFLIGLNKYLDSFPGATLSDKIGVTELNEILLNSMPNSWYNQAYVQGFDCGYISFKKAVNMFEHMDIPESIYEGVV